MNEVQLFTNEKLEIIGSYEFMDKPIDIYNTVENPLFLAKEVAEWIEHSNARSMIQSIDEDEKVVNNVYTPGGVQKSWFLTEDGLYEVLMLSRTKKAKLFKKKIKEILKEIRHTGSYSINGANHIEDPNERLAEIISKCTMVEQVDLIRDLYNIPAPSKNKNDDVNNDKSLKVLKNKDIPNDKDMYKTIDAFIKNHRISEGDFTRDVYRNYCDYCRKLNVTPRSRLAFVLRMKEQTRLYTIQYRGNSVIRSR